MKCSNFDPDELMEESPDTVSTELKEESSCPVSAVERRKFLKTGLITTAALAGEAILSGFSYLRDIFYSSDDTSEDS